MLQPIDGRAVIQHHYLVSTGLPQYQVTDFITNPQWLYHWTDDASSVLYFFRRLLPMARATNRLGVIKVQPLFSIDTNRDDVIHIYRRSHTIFAQAEDAKVTVTFERLLPDALPIVPVAA